MDENSWKGSLKRAAAIYAILTIIAAIAYFIRS